MGSVEVFCNFDVSGYGDGLEHVCRDVAAVVGEEDVGQSGSKGGCVGEEETGILQGQCLCYKMNATLTVWHFSTRQGPQALMAKGQMVRTPSVRGPFCQILSPGVAWGRFRQNWHVLDQTSCHICSSEKAGKGFGGFTGRALRAEAQMESDFRRRSDP